MKEYLNKRNLILVFATLLVVFLKWYTDPTAGAVTAEFMLYGATPIMAVLAVHWLRKLLFPYVDMGELYDAAKLSPVGAGLTFVGMALVIFGLLGLFGP